MTDGIGEVRNTIHRKLRMSSKTIEHPLTTEARFSQLFKSGDVTTLRLLFAYFAALEYKWDVTTMIFMLDDQNEYLQRVVQ